MFGGQQPFQTLFHPHSGTEMSERGALTPKTVQLTGFPITNSFWCIRTCSSAPVWTDAQTVSEGSSRAWRLPLLFPVGFLSFVVLWPPSPTLHLLRVQLFCPLIQPSVAELRCARTTKVWNLGETHRNSGTCLESQLSSPTMSPGPF